MNSFEIAEAFRNLHKNIVKKIEVTDGNLFHLDHWKREEGGGGTTAVLQNGNIIEKGGIAFSHVHGLMPEKVSKGLKIPQQQFHATGVSLIQHPRNPFVPIIHMNVRYFEMEDGTWWFGGGIDLTPHYPELETVKMFHAEIKAICDQYHPNFYAEFKPWADDYFFIEHRKEMRGVGGIFFDRLNAQHGLSKEQLFDFCLAVGNYFADVYPRLMLANHQRPFTDENKNWQLIRRGRYVEFNLVYDKGTQFGLQTDGRVESILMSLPTYASWVYDHKPEPGSTEHQALAMFQKGNDWVGM